MANGQKLFAGKDVTEWLRQWRTRRVFDGKIPSSVIELALAGGLTLAQEDWEKMMALDREPFKPLTQEEWDQLASWADQQLAKRRSMPGTH
jgi:hypothetical protein